MTSEMSEMSGLQVHDLDLLQRILKELEQKEVQTGVPRQEFVEPSLPTPARRRKCISRGNSGHQADAETALPSSPWSTTTSPCSSLPPTELRERLAVAPRIPLRLDGALRIRPPPGLPEPLTEVDASTGSSSAGFAEAQIEENLIATSWEWTIVNPNAKFKGNCGCPLVSPPFGAGCLEDLRVIFSPGESWVNAQPKDAKKMKKKDETKKAWQKLPKHGSLQVKFGEQPGVQRVTLFFQIGDSYRLGPFSACPEHSTSQVCELTQDWRSFIDQSKGSLTIRVEVTQSGWQL